MQKEMLFWIWLSEAMGAASRDFKRLIALYESPYDLFHADEEEIDRLDQISPRARAALQSKDLGRAAAILDACERGEIGVLPYSDPLFPAALRELKDPPVLLYYSGTLPLFDRTLSLGLVGTRRMSAYGMRTAYKISYELAASGVIVVSGMAAGIDGVCAAAALAARGGVTAAILGCGLDVVYPRHHKRLMEEIRQKGVLLSEYPPGTRPNHYHFPIRNRLISGLTQGTVVVEAGLGSGSLITAKDAMLQGRDVYALPANVDSAGAEGTNALLRDHAKMVLDTADLLEPYAYLYAGRLFPERLAEAKKHSQADLPYLESLGVIELAKKSMSVSADICAAEPPTKPKSASTKVSRKKASAKAAEPLPGETGVLSAPAEQKTPKETPDEVLSSLTPVQLAVLGAIPDDRAVTADTLGRLGYPYADVIAALTMLEILGLIQKLPGALYIKS